MKYKEIYSEIYRKILIEVKRNMVKRIRKAYIYSAENRKPQREGRTKNYL